MFLPFQTSLSMWFAAQPIYELEPEPPVDASATGSADSGAPASEAATAAAAGTTAEGNAACEPTPPPPPAPPKQRLVYKGIEWRAFQVRHTMENPAWALAAQNRKDEDDSRGQTRARALPPMPPQPDDAASAPPAE